MKTKEQITRERLKWESGDAAWRASIKRDEERAREKQSQPSERCCFGIMHPKKRCKNAAVFGITFYGYTTGLSFCAEHGREGERDYPHGEIRL